MDFPSILLLLLTVATLSVLIFVIRKQKTAPGTEEAVRLVDELRNLRRDVESLNSQHRTELQQRLETMNDRLFRTSNDQSTQLQSNLKQTSEMIQTLVSKFTTEFKEQSGEFKSTQKQILDFGSQLSDLQNILKNPKQRGILGEYFLETVLKNTLPPDSYQMQYKFKDGEIVDAAVFINGRIVPVDSKFSLENYNRVAEETNEAEKDRLEKVFVNDLKERVKETSKYIRPDEGTVDFAFMFIPHEAIYYDLIVNKIGTIEDDTENILQRAASKYHVIIVSPTSFLAYLQTVLQGLKALRVEKEAEEIKKRVDDLGRHLKQYSEYHEKLGSALSTTVNHYNTAGKAFRLMDKDVMRIAGSAPGLETVDVSRPTEE